MVLNENPVFGVTLTQRQRKAYEFIRKHQPCTPTEVADHLFPDKAGGPTTALNMVSGLRDAINRELAKIGQVITTAHGQGDDKGYQIIKLSKSRAYKPRNVRARRHKVLYDAMHPGPKVQS